MIISGGFNIYPAEVEAALLSHPNVAAAAVVGRPDPHWGEAAVAFLVLRDGAVADAAALLRYVRERKGPVLVPKELRFIDALPLTALGKTDRKALRAEAEG
jgi:fatty-acyl-CoA synthase